MIHVLDARIQDLNRRIYASYPWGYRVAQLLVKLSFSLTDTVGRVIYAWFLDAGVEGMPSGGAPGTKPERLPPGYGHQFAQRLYAYLLKKSRNPDHVETILANLLEKAAAGKLNLPAGTPLRKAESYIFTIATNLLTDLVRIRRKGPKVNVIPFDDIGGEETFDPADPSSFQHLQDLLPRSELQRLMREIDQINPRALGWLEAQLNGVRSKDLAAEWGVSKSTVSMWEHQYLPKIKSVVMKYLRDVAA